VAAPQAAPEVEAGSPRASREDLERSHEPGRGRDAETPAEISPRGWADILNRVFRAVIEDRNLANAAGVTFYALLGIFPAVGTVVSLYGLVADASTILNHLALLSNVVPATSLDLFREYMTRMAAKGSDELGLAFFVGLAISLWTANAGMSALFDALNVVHKERDKRSYLAFYGMTLLFTLGAILFLILAISAVVVLPAVLASLRIGATSEQILAVLRWPALFAVVVAWLSLIYRFGPDRREPKWRWVNPGSVVAALLWILTSMLFSWYVANFGRYDEVYGSLGAVVGFMTWIWISSIVVLLGAELNAEMEHQTARDTTEGAPKPLGRRGAVMADTVGRAREG